MELPIIPNNISSWISISFLSNSSETKNSESRVNLIMN